MLTHCKLPRRFVCTTILELGLIDSTFYGFGAHLHDGSGDSETLRYEIYHSSPRDPYLSITQVKSFAKSFNSIIRSLWALLLPLVSREWKNSSNSSYNCTPFLHSLLTKGKLNDPRLSELGYIIYSLLWILQG